jgi:hypothetical protein
MSSVVAEVSIATGLVVFIAGFAALVKRLGVVRVPPVSHPTPALGIAAASLGLNAAALVVAAITYVLWRLRCVERCGAADEGVQAGRWSALLVLSGVAVLVAAAAVALSLCGRRRAAIFTLVVAALAEIAWAASVALA